MRPRTGVRVQCRFPFGVSHGSHAATVGAGPVAPKSPRGNFTSPAEGRGILLRGGSCRRPRATLAQGRWVHTCRGRISRVGRREVPARRRDRRNRVRPLARDARRAGRLTDARARSRSACCLPPCFAAARSTAPAPLAVFALTAAASTVLNGLGYPTGPRSAPRSRSTCSRAPSGRESREVAAALVVIGFYLIHAGATGIAEDEFPTVRSSSASWSGVGRG